MENFKDLIREYKNAVIVYIMYVPMAIFFIDRVTNNYDFWAALLIWIITIPIIVTFIIYSILKFIKTPVNNNVVNENNPNLFFIKTWDLIDFANEYGTSLQRVKCVDNNTEEIYHMCLFADAKGKQTWVNFMSYLGELTAEEILYRKYELKIGKNNKGKYYLYDDNFKVCEKINL